MRAAISFGILIVYMLTTSGCYTRFSPPGTDAEVVTRSYQDSSLAFSSNGDLGKSDPAAELLTGGEHLNKGIRLYEEALFDEAIMELNTAIQVGLSGTRNLADAYGYLALCTFGKDQGDVVNVKKYLKEADKADPSWEPNKDDYNPDMQRMFEKVKAEILEIDIQKDEVTYEWMGITVRELTVELTQKLGYNGYNGVVISDVTPDSPFARSDDPPRPGDLIQAIDFESISNIQEFKRAIEISNGYDSPNVLVMLRRSETAAWGMVIRK